MAVEDYNWADRLVHRLAFGSKVPQDVLCDLEAQFYAQQIAQQKAMAPIFITSLPRAGTTVLLEVLARHPALVAHSYRDMPFVLSPIIWRRVSSRFHVAQDAAERSHGDGLMINVDSPEAFEEVLWLREFAGHYAAKGIKTWDRLPDAFVKTFRDHMKALIASRGVEHGGRYLSKNNANIARYGALARAMPDAKFLLPLRHPLDQAASLLQQHVRAMAEHDATPFARAYTRDVGHFEFGRNHRPILFGEFATDGLDALHIDYWLAYWTAAHRQFESDMRAIVLDMEALTSGVTKVETVFEKLDLAPSPEAQAHAGGLLRPLPHRREDSGCDANLLNAATALYETIRSRAI
ncbi:sulfotransferase [Croceicoccus sediminis]|uniref:sulfotransferase n=1 Tax=Croceicoccus sediminis TaxID=2571150 RepID=UPI0011842B15|nr:sulfotransferase [Croceicoccus sediminis]